MNLSVPGQRHGPSKHKKKKKEINKSFSGLDMDMLARRHGQQSPRKSRSFVDSERLEAPIGVSPSRSQQEIKIGVSPSRSQQEIIMITPRKPGRIH